MSEQKPEKAKARGRGPGRTQRKDWIQVALDTLVSEGVDSIKVSSLAEKLECARSSFYWYFKNRSDLLDALLNHWQSTNTKLLVESANQPAESINYAVNNVYIQWISGRGFDTQLDFAIRDWARRSGSVRRALDISDAARLEALTHMFERYDYQKPEAETRARILYFTQIGYDLTDLQEDWETRQQRGRMYLFCMTGKPLTEAETKAHDAARPPP